MDLSPRVLGTATARALGERATAPLLRIGSDVFDRGALAHVQCFSFVAAANLSAILNATFAVKHTRDVFFNLSPAALALPRLGAVSLAVLGAAFEAKGLGGDAPLEAWVQHHAQAGAKHPLVTFLTIKKRDAAGAAAERKTRQRISHARKTKAHRLRLARFQKAG